MAAAPRHEAGRAADRPRHGGADGRAESARDRAARSDPGVAGHATAEPGAAAPLPTGAGRRDEAACRPARPVSGPAKRQRAGRADAPGWTVAAVERRVVEAVDTLKRVPVPDIQRNVTRWPGFIRDVREAYGYAQVRVRLAPAAPDAITRLDETLDWLRCLPPAAQRIAWSRASGFSWRRIAAFVGKSPNTCRAWYRAALHHLAGRLTDAAAAPRGRRAARRRRRGDAIRA